MRREHLAAVPGLAVHSAVTVDVRSLLDTSAGLNYGDCSSYALAHVRQQRMLLKVDDVAQTDVAPAI